MMKSSIIFAIFSIILFTSTVDAKKECGFVCNEWDFGPINETINERVILNLKREGPADGICLTKDKWIISGSEFGYPTQCFCLDIPTDVKIKPGDGPKCAAAVIASPSETFFEHSLRMYNSAMGMAPPNGSCEKGEIKWIIKGKPIGKPNDTCYCYKNFDFVSPKVQCVDVPSSSSSTSEENQNQGR